MVNPVLRNAQTSSALIQSLTVNILSGMWITVKFQSVPSRKEPEPRSGIQKPQYD